MEQQLKDNPGIFRFYCPERSELLNKMKNDKNTKQTDKELYEEKKILLEKIKICHEFEIENNIIKEESEREIEIQNELIKTLIKDDKIIKKCLEDYNQLQNLMQSCINGQEQVNTLKENFSKKINKQKEKDNTKDTDYVNKIKNKYVYLQKLKCQHLQKLQEYEYSNKQSNEEIAIKQQNILQLQVKLMKNYEKKGKLVTENKIILDEINILSDKFTEIQTKLIEFNKQKEKSTTEYKNKITKLSNDENKNSIQTLQQELTNIQKGFESRNEFYNDLIIQKQKSIETYSDIKLKCTPLEEEINKLTIQCQIENEDFNNKLNNLKQKIQEVKERNSVPAEENKVLEMELVHIQNEENNLKKQISNIEISINNLNFETKQELDLLEEHFQKFQDEVSLIKSDLGKETAKQNSLNNEEEVLNLKLQNLNAEYEMINEQNDAINGEAQIEEFKMNRQIEVIQSDIQKIKNHIETIKTNILKETSFQNTQLQQLELEYNEKDAEYSQQFINIKDEINERNQHDETIKANEIKKLRETKFNLELQLSEFKVSRQNLEKELNLKIGELDEITKFKKPKYDFKIPKVKIPPSKYSSSASDSSIENTTLNKRRKVTFKYRRSSERKENLQKIEKQLPQQDNKDVFDNIKYGLPTSKSTRKRTIKKAVF